MKKKLTAIVLALGAMFGACADTEFANGYTWNYRIRDGKEAILYAYSPNSDRPSAISPSPTGHVTVPSYLGGKPLVEIGGDSFLKCGGLTGVTIPSSVRSIGDSAFGLCTGLVSVTIPSSVTNIGVGAFIETGLRHVVVPDSVTSIGGSAFGACPNLESAEIGNGATMLPTHIFYNDEKLQSVTIGRNVRSVDSWAFLNCSNLTSIAVSPESPYLKSESGLLLTKDGKTLVVGVNMNGDVVVPNGVTNIADMAFYHRTGVTGVLLPAGLKAIGERAFSGCSNLSGISIPESVESILFAAFGYCPLITSVNIPDGVQFVAPCLFEECFSLKSIRIGVGVTNIGYSAFSCCTNLVDVEICGPVKSIDFEAFALCLSLSSLSLPAELENIGECAFISCNGLKDLLFHGDAPTVGEFAFADFDWNTEMLFPLTNCIVSVRRGTTGWGEVPGEWNGMQTQYLATFVTYDENWAGGTKTKKELSDGDGILANAPADPKREGWYFCGWFTESEGGLKVTGATVADGDATYYAQWGKPVATFAAGAVSSSESKTVKLTVYGGSLTGPSSVKVFMMYQTAAAADLDLANATINGVKVKGGLKFPLTLAWDTADVTPYVIEIPLKGDKTVEDDEAVTFQLADVVGTEMGETDVCTVTVEDPAFDELRGRIETGTATKAESNSWIKVSHDGIPYFRCLPFPADGGKATGSGYCPANKKVTLKASASKGFAFAGWTTNEERSASAPYPDGYFVATTPSLVIDRTTKPAKDTKTSTTISNLTESTTFYAVFEGDARVTATPVEFTEDGGVVASDGGKVTGTGRYAPGKKVTLKATANKGFAFGGWYDVNGKLRMENGKLVDGEGGPSHVSAETTPLSQSASLSFEMGEEDVDLYARFVTTDEDRGSIAAGLNGGGRACISSGRLRRTRSRRRQSRCRGFPRG